MKNNFRKIFFVLLILIFIGLFLSCNYTSKKNKNKTEKTSLEKKEEIKDMAEKKQGKIKDANISKHGVGSAQGGKVTNENPLGL